MDILLQIIQRKIEVLITGVLKDFPIPDTTFYFNKGDKVRVGHLVLIKVQRMLILDHMFITQLLNLLQKLLLDSQVVVLQSKLFLIMDF